MTGLAGMPQLATKFQLLLFACDISWFFGECNASMTSYCCKSRMELARSASGSPPEERFLKPFQAPRR
jgi:hypothetical protein